MTVAICPGSFDPPTEGHLNIIRRGLKIFDKIIVVVAAHSGKKPVLSVEERMELLRSLFKNEPSVEIDTFRDRLLVEFARSKKARVVLKGLRTLQDYEYEFQMALANKKLAPEIETVFMMTEAEYSHVSSTLIKEILRLGGSCAGMLPPEVEKRLKKKIQGKGMRRI